MLIPSDYKKLLRILNKFRVKYLVIGAYAVIYYTEPRYTKDLDIWIQPEIKNAKRTYKALKEFGAPLRDVTPKDFTNKNLVYQIGVEPIRVDIIMGMSAIEFETAWRNREISTFDGIKVNIIGINELLKSKKKIRRGRDIVDIESLEYSQRLRRKK